MVYLHGYKRVVHRALKPLIKNWAVANESTILVSEIKNMSKKYKLYYRNRSHIS